MKIRKSVFHHIPKTGGHAVKMVMWRHYENDFDFVGHRIGRVATDRKKVLMHKKSGAFVFTTVRHPYTRFISAWNYVRKGGMFNQQDTRAQKFLDRFESVEEFVMDADFDEMVKRLIHFLPISKIMCTDKKVYDYVMRQERLEEDMNNVTDILGLERLTPLPKANTGPKTPVELTSAMRSRLAYVYRNDFAKFKYDT